MPAYPRSLLFTPADEPGMLRKALDTDADACIFDLEDAVPKREQLRAREHLIEVLGAVDRGGKQIYARIEATDTEYWLGDLQAAIDAGVDGILLPKVETPDDVALVTGAAEQLSDRRLEFTITIESPQGLFGGEAIARWCRDRDDVTGLSFGTADYCREIGAPVIDPSVGKFAEQFLLGYAAIGNLAATGPGGALDIDDLAGLRDLARRQRKLGFVGKGCLHPKQVPVVNEAFTPSETEYEEAQRLVEAYDADERNSLRVDGVFLDEATADRYRGIISRFEERRNRSG